MMCRPQLQGAAWDTGSQQQSLLRRCVRALYGACALYGAEPALVLLRCALCRERLARQDVEKEEQRRERDRSR